MKQVNICALFLISFIDILTRSYQIHQTTVFERRGNVGMFNGNRQCLWNKFCLWPNPLVNSCCSLHWRRGTKSEAKRRKSTRTNQLRRRTQQQVRRRGQVIGIVVRDRKVVSAAEVRPQSHRLRHHHQNVSTFLLVQNF